MIGYRKELMEYDTEVRTRAEVSPTMHWYDKGTKTLDDLIDVLRKHPDIDGILAPDVMYYPEYRKAISEFISPKQFPKQSPMIIAVMNFYS